MQLPRVVWWSNMPTPYFIERLNAVARRGNVDLEVWFNVERESDRSWEIDPKTWQFRARYVPKGKFLAWNLQIPVAELRDNRPDIFVQEYFWAPLAIGSLVARRWAQRTAFRVLPNFDAWSDRTWWREMSKHLLFRSLDSAKVPGLDGARLALKYGLPANRMSVVTQSIDVQHYAKARFMRPENRVELRQGLGLRGCVFIFVGRLWSGKGLDYLLEAYRLAKTCNPNISLLIVGDGRDEIRYRHIAKDMADVVFAGFVQGRELPDLYALADVMVFPTLGDPNGLVVEEAMAAGLPVICSQAAGDIHQRLPDGLAGYIIPPADAIDLADRMTKLANDAGLRNRMSTEAIRLVCGKHHERYAVDFEYFVDLVLSRPRRKSLASGLAWILGELVTRMCVNSDTVVAGYVPTATSGDVLVTGPVT